ncbi:MAG: Imm27 family immunity protein [Verrucomicrobiota bacterium]
MSEEIPDRLSSSEGEAYAKEHLQQIKVDDVEWKILHRNPKTGQYWKEWFPRSHMHGGGPPEFVKISDAEAREEFGIP